MAGSRAVPDGSETLAALSALPCGARLLAVLDGRPDAYLVGGAVRDLLLGRTPRELDVVVVGDPAPVASALGRVEAAHDRFGTFVVLDGACEFDVVMARAESYARPGALPDVRPGRLDEDLRRRDFTVNAIALSPAGELHAAGGALEDLEAGRLRVLHEGSFTDDPTRLWRLVRYAVRLGFAPDPETDRLAVEAVGAGALETVSADRLGAELRLALRERDPLAVLHAAQNLGLVSGLDLDPARVAHALALLPPEGRPDLALLGAIVPDGAWAEAFGFGGAELRTIDRAARLAPLEPVPPARPSEITERLRHEPVEAVAVAGARGHAGTALRFLNDWRHIGLEIDGRDLLAAGVPEGPEVGERLRRVLAARLDGELPPGRDAELATALAEDPAP
jgi:tRNA nucleotidyltransferase (CCA-adding enzyme)